MYTKNEPPMLAKPATEPTMTVVVGVMGGMITVVLEADAVEDDETVVLEKGDAVEDEATNGAVEDIAVLLS